MTNTWNIVAHVTYSCGCIWEPRSLTLDARVVAGFRCIQAERTAPVAGLCHFCQTLSVTHFWHVLTSYDRYHKWGNDKKVWRRKNFSLTPCGQAILSVMNSVCLTQASIYCWCMSTSGCHKFHLPSPPVSDDHLPQPIVCLVSHQGNWARRKSFKSSYVASFW